jgi:hypothetical protein
MIEKVTQQGLMKSSWFSILDSFDYTKEAKFIYELEVSLTLPRVLSCS